MGPSTQLRLKLQQRTNHPGKQERMFPRDGGYSAPGCSRGHCRWSRPVAPRLLLLLNGGWPQGLDGPYTVVKLVLRRSLGNAPVLPGFSSGPGGRACRGQGQCEAHRGRAHTGDRRVWSTGYRATCGERHRGERRRPLGRSLFTPLSNRVSPTTALSPSTCQGTPQRLTRIPHPNRPL